MDILRAVIAGIGFAGITIILWYAATAAMVGLMDYLRSRQRPPDT